MLKAKYMVHWHGDDEPTVVLEEVVSVEDLTRSDPCSATAKSRCNAMLYEVYRVRGLQPGDCQAFHAIAAAYPDAREGDCIAIGVEVLRLNDDGTDPSEIRCLPTARLLAFAGPDGRIYAPLAEG